MTTDEAITRLETLRFGWRGDDHEYKVLQQLGELYLSAGKYKQGIETLRYLQQLVPDSTFSTAAAASIADAAGSAFSSARADRIAPLDALDLYDMLVPIVPPGTITEAETRGLSDRLASVGVLGRAADLLEPVMKAQTGPAEKARLGARMAGLRLLDDHPDTALKALEDSSPHEAKLDDTLAAERKLLQSRALFKLGRPDEAIAAMQGLDSREADALRVEIAWNTHKWGDAATALDRLAGAPPANATMSPETANIVLNEAVALSLADDAAGLQRLGQQFGPGMAKPALPFLHLLTSPGGGNVRSPTVDAVKASVSGLDIFENFLSTYRKPDKA